MPKYAWMWMVAVCVMTTSCLDLPQPGTWCGPSGRCPDGRPCDSPNFICPPASYDDMGPGDMGYVSSSPLDGVALVGVSVVDDTDGDGRLGPGESGELRIQVRNPDGASIPHLSGALSTTNPGIATSAGSAIQFGDVAGGALACGNTAGSGKSGDCTGTSATDYPRIALTRTVPTNTPIPFVLALADTQGHSATLSFSLLFSEATPPDPGKPDLAIFAVSVVGDSNRDGLLSPGESAGLKIQVRNSGGVDAMQVTGTLSATSAGVTIDAGTGIRFGDVLKNSRAAACGNAQSLMDGGNCAHVMATDYPQLTLSEAVPTNTPIPFTLALVDAQGNRTDLSFVLSFSAASGPDLHILRGRIVGDTNHDGRLSPGESAGLELALYDRSNTGAAQVTGTLSTTTAGITLDAAAGIRFGDLPGNSYRSVCGNSAASGKEGDCNNGNSSAALPRITVSNDVPEGTEAQFMLALTDARGDEVALPFRVEIAPQITVPSTAHELVPRSVTVVGDTNGDGKLSPGESGDLRIKIQNQDSTAAPQVLGALSTIYRGVTLAQRTGIQFGDLGANDEACGVAAGSPHPGSCADGELLPHITISDDAIPGTLFSLALSLTDANGKQVQWAIRTEVSAVDRDFALNARIVDDTNGDGSLSPGETANLEIYVQNTGPTKTYGVTGQLWVEDGWTTASPTDGIQFGDIEPGRSSLGFPAVQLTMPSDESPGFLWFDLLLTDAIGQQFTMEFTVLTTPSPDPPPDASW